MIMAAFIQKKARSNKVGDQTVDEDHLILVYPFENDPPFIIGDERVRSFCHGAAGSYFSIQDDGSLIPGWKKLLDFYTWLSKNARLNKELNREGHYREGYSVKLKGAGSAPAAAMSSTDLVTLRKQVSAEIQEHQNQREISLRKEFTSRADVEGIMRSMAASICSRLDRLETTSVQKEEFEDTVRRLTLTMATKEELALQAATTQHTLRGVLTSLQDMDAELQALQARHRPALPPPPARLAITAAAAPPQAYAEDDSFDDMALDPPPFT